MCATAGACDAGNAPDGPGSPTPCAALGSGVVEGSGDEVVVRGTDALCTIEFREVVTLGGDREGTLPRPPVAAGPGGRWLTATYSEGEVALWSASGELERLIGRGPGEGPGEFEEVSDLVVDSAGGAVYVLTSSPRVQVYSLDGGFLEGIRLPAPASTGTRLPDGTLVTTRSAPPGTPTIVLVRADSVFATGRPSRAVFPPRVAPGAEGVWAIESPWYQIDRHTVPDGSLDVRVRREVSWFPELTEAEGRSMPGPLLFGFSVDEERRLVFARILQVPDPDAPGAPFPLAGGPDEATEAQRRYFDGVVEALGFDGRLLGATRFDDAMDTPSPLGGGSPGNLWFRVAEDATGSIEILRPELVDGAGS